MACWEREGGGGGRGWCAEGVLICVAEEGLFFVFRYVILAMESAELFGWADGIDTLFGFSGYILLMWLGHLSLRFTSGIYVHH